MNTEPRDEPRLTGRIDVRIGEGVSVFLTRNADPEALPVEYRVMDYSSSGLGVEAIATHGTADLSVDEEVRVEFHLNPRGKDTYTFPCKVTRSNVLPDGRAQYGLERIDHDTSRVERILSKTHELPEQTHLVGLIDHPFLFDMTSVIHVERVSSKYFVVRNQDPSFAIFPSIEVIFSLNLFTGNEPIHGQVIYAKPIESGGVRFAIKLTNLPESCNRGLVRYMMRMSPLDPLALKRVGLDTSHVKNILTYRFVRPEDREEVYRLRYLAYNRAKKVPGDVELNRMVYDYDEYSRNLTVWHHNMLVASTNMIFADGVEHKFEIQKHITEEEFRTLPVPQDMMEVAGLCVHPAYRKSDVLVGLFERMFQVMVTAGKRYAIMASDRFLREIYEAIGWKATGIKYTVSKGRTFELGVYLIDVNVGAYGRGLDPMQWDSIYHRMSEHLESAGLLKKSPTHRIVSPVYKAYIDLFKTVQNTPYANIVGAVHSWIETIFHRGDQKNENTKNG